MTIFFILKSVNCEQSIWVPPGWPQLSIFVSSWNLLSKNKNKTGTNYTSDVTFIFWPICSKRILIVVILKSWYLCENAIHIFFFCMSVVVFIFVQVINLEFWSLNVFLNDIQKYGMMVLIHYYGKIREYYQHGGFKSTYLVNV